MVALLFCFPVGLFCVWTHPRYTQKTKMVVTGVVALLAVIAVASGGTTDLEDDDVATGSARQDDADDGGGDAETSTTDAPTTEAATTESPTTTESTTTTTEAPTTRPPTTVPPPESVALGAEGQQATAPFQLDGGRYSVQYRFGGDCFYGAILQSTSDEAFVFEDVGSGNGPIEGDTNIYSVESGEYYVDMITGPAPGCPWEIVLTAAD